MKPKPGPFPSGSPITDIVRQSKIPPVRMSSCITLAAEGSQRGILRMELRGGEVLPSGS